MDLHEYINLEEDEITEIIDMGDAETVDITVDDTHMFFCEGIYTHNSSLSTEVVTVDQMGGSIKKAQIGHFIMTLSRPQAMREENKAVIAVLKSRFGKDGIVFKDCDFNNGTLQVNINENEDNTNKMPDIDVSIDNNERLRNLVQNYSNLRQ